MRSTETAEAALRKGRTRPRLVRGLALGTALLAAIATGMAAPAAGPQRIPATRLSSRPVQGSATVLINPYVPSSPGALPRYAQAATSSGPPGDAYTPLPPTRILDTRVSGAPLQTGAAVALTVSGTATVPQSATAVVLNVTVTDNASAGYLGLYPTGGPLPLVSNLNWAAGETVANLVVVQVGVGGQVSIFDGGGPTAVIVDLQGYFSPELSGSSQGSYVPLAPTRLVDTRPGSGYLDAGETLGPQSVMNVQVAGADGIPPSGALAVVANVTVTDTTSAGYLAVYPSGLALPATSNLNWAKGQTVANRVIVPIGANGEVTLANQLGNADVIVDIDGYFSGGGPAPTAASLFTPITPVRVIDTRSTSSPLQAGRSLTQQLAGVDGIAPDASAVAANLTATQTTAASFFTAYPQAPRPTSSDLNWTAGQTAANLALMTLSPDGATSVYNNAGSAALVVDAFGYFTPLRPPLRVATTSVNPAVVGVPYAVTLEAVGGVAPYSWTVAAGALPEGMQLSSGGLLSGTPTTAESSFFTVTVSDSTTPIPLSASGQIVIDVLISMPSVFTSANWAGYAVGSGPFTKVSGTFNVPGIGAEPVSTDVSEWVGVDGITNSSLIQAGINEEYSNSNNQVQITAWWEILPAASTTITSLDVSPGDSVTVSLQQLSAAEWAITVADNSTAHTFTTEQQYSGPQASAEWIVEAPLVNSGEAVLAPYYPDVTFSSLSTSGPVNSADLFAMVQNGSQVATPSLADASGVTVAYGDMAPPPP